MSVANVPRPTANDPKAYWGRTASRVTASSIRTTFPSKRAELAVRHLTCGHGQARTSSLGGYLPSRWQQTQRCETRCQAGHSKRDEHDGFQHRNPRTRAYGGVLAKN